MKPYKKPKYRIDIRKIPIKKDGEPSAHDIYEEMLKDKIRRKR